MSDDYSQPDFYRFNTDSLELVKHVLENGIRPGSILDLGAGSGIIGIEIARALKPQRVTFLELQPEYLEHLKNNCLNFLPETTSSEIQITSFGEFRHTDKFDLIVCNPPYYLPGRGELPQDPRRAMARTFLKDGWDILLKIIALHLSKKGKAFIVLKKDEKLRTEIENQAQGLKLIMKKIEVSDLMILELLTLNVD